MVNKPNRKGNNLHAVIAYLVAIIAANLSAAAFGPSWTIVNAVLFIGFDLTMRDRLHERWRGDWKRMGALILAGSLAAFLINTDAGPIAVASAVAFGAAGIADWIVYRLLGDRTRMVRINGSNIVSALVDSIIFPTIAFGGFLPAITAGQWVAKVAGGAVWAFLIYRYTTRTDAVAHQ